MNIDTIAVEILEHAKDDWVDFAEVMSIVRSHFKSTESDIVQQSVKLIDRMLKGRQIVVGELQKRGDMVSFSPWNESPELIMKRINEGLAMLGHRPGIGDICWLSTI